MWRAMKVATLTALFLVSAIERQASATIYYFDATTGGISGTGGPVNVAIGPSVIGISFGTGYMTPLFKFPSGEFQPGDTIDFGSVALGPAGISGDQYGDIGFGYDYFQQYVGNTLPNGFPYLGEVFPNGIDSCNGEFPPNNPCSAMIDLEHAEILPTVQQLLFVIGTGDTYIQMAWAFGDYSPPLGLTPTPLPAGLPLFATGLGGLGLLGWRRKKRLYQ